MKIYSYLVNKDINKINYNKLIRNKENKVDKVILLIKINFYSLKYILET